MTNEKSWFSWIQNVFEKKPVKKNLEKSRKQRIAHFGIKVYDLTELDSKSKGLIPRGKSESYKMICIDSIQIILNGGGKPAEVISQLLDSPDMIFIEMPEKFHLDEFTLGNHVQGDGSVIQWSPEIMESGPDATGGTQRPAIIGLVHESFHLAIAERMRRIRKELDSYDPNSMMRRKNQEMLKIAGGEQKNLGWTPNDEEVFAVYLENQFRKTIHIPERVEYSPSDKMVNPIK